MCSEPGGAADRADAGANGAEANHSKPRPDIRTLPAYLQSLGYEVVAFGKVAHYRYTADYGFDHFAHDTFHDDVAIANGITWLRQRKRDKPLCILFGSNWPHVPWPATSEGYDPNTIRVPASHVDTPQTRQMRATYYAAVSRMDKELGAVIEATTEVLGPNTLMLFSADHGAQWPFGKWTLYDAGIRTPMIAVWPGQMASDIRIGEAGLGDPCRACRSGRCDLASPSRADRSACCGGRCHHAHLQTSQRSADNDYRSYVARGSKYHAQRSRRTSFTHAHVAGSAVVRRVLRCSW